jgi:hypothetical protein
MLSYLYLFKDIDGLVYEGGSTRTDTALGCVKDKMLKDQLRANVPKTVCVMTDGMTWGGSTYVQKPSDDLRVGVSVTKNMSVERAFLHQQKRV